MFDINQLEALRKELKKQPLKVEYTGETSTGISPINVQENNVFLFKFTKEDVMNFINIFNDINKVKPSIIKTQLLNYCEDMARNQISPIECMLYASKTVNKKMGNNYQFMQMCADVISLSAERQSICIDSLEHILKNWNWDNQLKISIWACGKIGNAKLINYIYERFSDDEDFKFFCFSALIDSGKQEFIFQILEMVSKLDHLYEVDKRMGNFFVNNFLNQFQGHGLEQIEVLSLNSRQSGYPSRLIGKILGERGNLINQAKKASISGKQIEIDHIFFDCVRLIENDRTKRSMALVAMGVLKHPETAKYLISLFKQKGEQFFNNAEKQEFIATLGYIKCEQATDLLRNFEHEKQLRCHVWCAFYLMGDQNFLEIIITNFFHEKENVLLGNYIKVFRKIGSHESLMKRIFLENFHSVIAENDENRSRAFHNLKHLVEQNRLYYFFEMNTVIFDLFGFEDKEIKIDIQTQMNVLSILGKVMNISNSNRFTNFLFYVWRENMEFSESVQTKAQQLLKNKSIFMLKAPTT